MNLLRQEYVHLPATKNTSDTDLFSQSEALPLTLKSCVKRKRKEVIMISLRRRRI